MTPNGASLYFGLEFCPADLHGITKEIRIPSMNEVTPAADFLKRGRGMRKKFVDHDAQGGVIAMAVGHIGRHQIRWRPFQNQVTQLGQNGRGLGTKQVGEALVSPTEKAGFRWRNAQDFQSGHGFPAAELGPSLAVRRIQAPAP